jgi:O-antigen ligase
VKSTSALVYFEKITIFIYIFLLPFGALQFFNFVTPYLLYKISFVVMIFVNLRHLFGLFSYSNRKNKPIVLYFIIYTLVSLLNVKFTNPEDFQEISVYFGFFDLFLFLNLISYLVIQQNIKSNIYFPSLFLKAFIYSGFLLSICFYVDLFVEMDRFGRLTLFGDNSNSIGTFLAVSFIISFHYLVKGRLSFFTFFLLIAIFVIFLGILKTGSRASLISSLAVVIYFINFKGGFIRSLLRFLLLSVLIVLFIILISTQEIIGARMLNFINDGDVSGRDVIFLSVLPFIMEHWFLGIGISGYYNLTYQYFEGFFSPHNSLLEALIYTGFLGFIFFSKWILSVFKRSFFLKSEFNFNLFISLSVPVLIVLINSQFFLSKPIWVIIAIILGVNQINVTSKKCINFNESY